MQKKLSFQMERLLRHWNSQKRTEPGSPRCVTAQYTIVYSIHWFTHSVNRQIACIENIGRKPTSMCKPGNSLFVEIYSMTGKCFATLTRPFAMSHNCQRSAEPRRRWKWRRNDNLAWILGTSTMRHNCIRRILFFSSVKCLCSALRIYNFICILISNALPSPSPVANRFQFSVEGNKNAKMENVAQRTT